jgi:hypothetical protein
MLKPSLRYKNARPERLKSLKETLFFLILILLVILGNVFFYIVDANAVPANAFTVYLDTPFVQNSYVYENYSGDNPTTTHIASFDTLAILGSCEFDGDQIAVFTYLQSNGCLVSDTPSWGGATTLSSTPTIGGLGPNGEVSRYGVVSGNGVAIDFSEPQKYFGMWWTAGSYGNQIDFYQGNVLLASTSADDVQNRLSSGSNYLESLDGQQYNRDLYYGQPATYSVNGQPTDYAQLDSENSYSKGSLNPNEPFTYIHFFAEGDSYFDRIVMKAPGNGFEFDNLVVSSRTDLATSLNSGLVFQKTIHEAVEVSFDANSVYGGQGFVNPQYSSETVALQTYCPYWGQLCINNDYGGYFDSWNTQPDGSGVSFEEGDAYDFSEPLILYAQWIYSFNFFNDDTYAEWVGSSVVSGWDDLILPEPLGAEPGFEFDGWWAYNNDEFFSRVGGANEAIPFSTYRNFGRSYSILGVWTPVNESAPTLTSPFSLPVDPRTGIFSMPSMPIAATNGVSMCVDEVLSPIDPNPVTGSDLTFQFNASGVDVNGQLFTGDIVINSLAPITQTSGRYIRIRLAISTDTDCVNSNSYFVSLAPLKLGRSKLTQLTIN